MRKLLNNKIAMYLICALVALGLVFVLFTLSSHNGDTAVVVRVDKSVAVGTQITENMLTTKTIGSYGLDGAVIKDKAAVIGKYVKVPIAPEDNITPDKLSGTPTTGSGSVVVDNSQRLITIAVSNAAAGGGGYLKAGSLVEVVAYDSNDMTVETKLTGITVYCVKNSKLTDIESIDSKESNVDVIPAFVTLVVTPEQASTLVNTSYSEKIHLLLQK